MKRGVKNGTLSKQRKLERARQLQSEKRQYLIENGFPENQIRVKHLKLSWKNVKDLIDGNEIEESEKWFYACWADKSENVDSEYFLDEINSLDINELKLYIQNWLNDINDEGSNGIPGHVIIEYGTKSEVDIQKFFWQAREYDSIVYTNKFSLKGILRNTAFLIRVCTEENRAVVYKNICDYLKENMPTLYKKFK